MKKLIIFSLISFVIFVPQLRSISLAEYIKQYGMPQVDNDGRLDLGPETEEEILTDITGLNNLPDIDRVKTLLLDGNQLQRLPENIFQGFKNLEELNLNNNILQGLPANVFQGLQNLKQLILNGNKLQLLPTNIFKGLHNLEELDLSGNKLLKLPANIFEDLQNLEDLNLSNNRLEALPAINNLRRLEILGIRENPFKSSFIPVLIEMIHSLPNLGDVIYGRDWLPQPKEDVLIQLARITSPHLLPNLPSGVLDLLHLTQEERKEIERRRAGY